MRQAGKPAERLLLRVLDRLDGTLLRRDGGGPVPAHHLAHLPRSPAAAVAAAVLLHLLPRPSRRTGARAPAGVSSSSPSANFVTPEID